MDTVERDSLYRQYWYASGTNATMTRQLADIVAVIPNWVRLRESDVVLDIGCNDGTLLRQYPAETKVVKVGIDPAVNLAEQGRAHCDLHANDYFTSEVFLPLTGGRRAKVITSIAMFYDLDDPSAFVEDIRECLADDGIWIVQMSYTPLMMTQNAFDNVIHEHLEYYSLLSVDHLVRKHGLKILDVEFNDTNAGSFPWRSRRRETRYRRRRSSTATSAGTGTRACWLTSGTAVSTTHRFVWTSWRVSHRSRRRRSSCSTI